MTSGLFQPVLASRLNAPTVHTLSNGLTIIAEQMPTEAVNLSLWLGVGSAAEADSINGMAHFLEHMIFKGTHTLQSGEFERLVEQRGAITNAATSQDYTHYYITTAPKDFAALAPLQVDVVTQAAIPDVAFERERSVILEEIRRANDSPSRRMLYRSMEMSFERLPYRRPVLGPAEVIEQLTPQQMRDFHQTWYQPANITAVAVGNLPVDQLIGIVANSFEQALPAAASPESPARHWQPHPSMDSAPVAHQVEFPFQDIIRRDYEDDKLQQARLVMTWRVPGLATLQDTYALDVLASIIGHGRTARLVRDLREERGLVSSISASNMTFARQGVFYISAQLPTENLEQVEAAIAQHVQQLQDEPVTDAEINRVKTLVANRFVFGNETPSNRAGLYGYYQTLTNGLTAAIQYPDYIRSLTPEDLQAAARRDLSPTAYGAVVIRPGAAEQQFSF